MKERTLNELAQIEQAIEKRYGSEALTNPNANWNQEKEQEYLSQLKSLIQSEQKEVKEEKENYILIKKLITKQEMVCPICDDVLKREDDVYVTKYECCKKCFVKYIDGFREHLWEERKKKLLENKRK